MIKAILGFFACLLSIQLSAQGLPLARPRIDCKGVFFKTETKVGLEFEMDGSKIHYSINGSKPKLYKKPIIINKTSVLQAFATHPEFGRGDTATMTFQKVNLTPSSIQLKTNPNSEYKAMGATSLIDFQAGGSDLHDGKWLGFLNDSIVIEAEFQEKTPVNSVTMSVLNNQGAWVMPMRKINVYVATDEIGKWEAAGFWMPEGKSAIQNQSRLFAEVPVKKQTTRLKLIVYSFGPLPSSHPGAGNPAWLFIDEILFN